MVFAKNPLGSPHPAPRLGVWLVHLSASLSLGVHFALCQMRQTQGLRNWAGTDGLRLRLPHFVGNPHRVKPDHSWPDFSEPVASVP
jgi:hypothetical protein